ncbi:glycosyltransferase involved in cell wall biosynthesis [Nocardioides sp. BE266]|uniref:glycosyltransferase n=1 Tax=Nocardioides sp. BE266 TaxID=2817725 RepID=UPI0028580266|nr:glycosyltransferase [Nocardioides sp. BE266]MDR7252408.1 glycosyltransferase involved in cell wall biosynthesis [Nocardioides sp. BE266]
MRAVERLDRNWHVFQGLVHRAERLARRGRDERAAVAAMTAATYAWCNPTGTFASGSLEQVLADLGARLTAPAPVAERPAGSRPRVLHVVSQVYGTGGHTQMLANWIRLDTARDHSVALTGQGDREVPDKLTAVLSGDALVRLDAQHRRLVDRAAALRDLASAHDYVVLHVHPNDAVATIALSQHTEGRPEVLLVNHADHVFWIGVTAADRVVNLRQSGARLNVERRGVPEARNAFVVRPLQLRERERARAEARATLGIPADARVVASAADTYKYAAAGGETLLDILLPVLRDVPGTQLHVAGPTPDSEWSVLADQGLGRAWGLLPDVHTLLEAADVYVDSYPFSSLTSVLEAGAMGTPVLTLRPGGDALGVLGADTPELDDDLVVAGSGQELAAEVTRLLQDDAARDELGASTGAAVHRSHGDGAWAEAVGKVLDAPPAAGPASAPGRAVRHTDELDRKLLLMMANGVGQGLAGTLETMAPQLPWGRRLETAARLARTGTLRPALLLPASAASRIRRLRSRSA